MIHLFTNSTCPCYDNCKYQTIYFGTLTTIKSHSDENSMSIKKKSTKNTKGFEADRLCIT